jgi:hypothetical protein
LESTPQQALTLPAPMPPLVLMLRRAMMQLLELMPQTLASQSLA